MDGGSIDNTSSSNGSLISRSTVILEDGETKSKEDLN